LQISSDKKSGKVLCSDVLCVKTTSNDAELTSFPAEDRCSG